MKDENGDLMADSHSILNMWKKYFSQLLNVQRASDVRRIELHTAKPLIPDLGPVDVKIAITELKRHKLSGMIWQN
jgi:hypothetical protein